MDINTIIKDFYDKVNMICTTYVRHDWCSDWSHEKDINSSSHYTMMGKYLVLTYMSSGIRPSFNYDDLTNLDIDIDVNNLKSIQIRVKMNGPHDRSYYFNVDNEVSWRSTESYLLDLIRNSYDFLIKNRNLLDVFKCDGYKNNKSNPTCFKLYDRENKLKEIGIDEV